MNFSLPGFGSSPSLPPPTVIPTEEDPAVKRREQESRDAAQRRRGLVGTNKTSGVGDPTDAPVRRKALLGSGL